MNDNINIAELLKDCPKGTKLYSTVFGEVELKEVKDNGRSVCIFVTNFYGQEEMFYPDGKYNTHYSDSECTLFPSKEQRDWSKFCPFKDGDVIYVRTRRSDWVSIFKNDTKHQMFTYTDYNLDNNNFYGSDKEAMALCQKHEILEKRIATEEEKEKLFRALKDNGYKWNAETKTLEKLTEPKFKEGDIVYTKAGNLAIISRESDSLFHAICRLFRGRILTEFILVEPERFATEEEKQKLFQAIKGNGYRWNADTKTLEKEEKKDKFDITPLKPFDKVLVRNEKCEHWMMEFFEKTYKAGYLCYKGIWKQCVPYEGNQHLLGTTNDCDEFYKTCE